MYLVKTPKLIQNLFPNFIWKMPDSRKKIYLTFDDGPIPEVTPWVLELLKKYDAKATFFCVGDNVRKYQDVFDQVVADGHAVGNHTFNHLNGWSNDSEDYAFNVARCSKLVDSVLFRPPYGRLTPKQAKILGRSYKIVMWDVLSGDFDPKLSQEQCLHNVIQKATNGSIVVFHDSLKASDTLEYVLPRVLEHFSELGYQFEQIPQKKSLNQQDLYIERA